MTGAADPPQAGDPSMEDILASIRRILSEEEAVPAPEQGAVSVDDVLVLDHSMMIPEHKNVASDLPPPPDHPEAQTPAATTPAPSDAPLVAPAAAAAAASSVGSLVKTLSSRSTQIYGGGPTLEDMVRDEIRPLLKAWLDANLPVLVERLVRAEIERVVGRAEH